MTSTLPPLLLQVSHELFHSINQAISLSVCNDAEFFRTAKKVPHFQQAFKVHPTTEEEEVFAEDYDEEDETRPDASRDRGGAPGCPNKYIPFHVCTDFCFDHWQEGYPESRLSERYLNQRRKMLRNYPLPEGWSEIYDAGIRRHYYWNQNTDEVCWLSPKHPKAVISEAAPKIAREMWSVSGHGPLGGGGEDREERGGGERRERKGGRGAERRERRKDERERMALAKRARVGEEDSDEDKRPVVELSERDKLKRARRRGIDPMDPSAYGEAEEGSWMTGLREDQEVKTGVDVTASGPLFQQRPYPAPGAILRRQHPDKYPPQ